MIEINVIKIIQNALENVSLDGHKFKVDLEVTIGSTKSDIIIRANGNNIASMKIIAKKNLKKAAEKFTIDYYSLLKIRYFIYTNGEVFLIYDRLKLNNEPIEVEIKDYHEQVEKNKNNGKLGGRPKKTQVVISGLPDESQNNPNHKPLTINHKPIKENKRGSRLPQDWFLTKAMGDWATQERPDLDVRQVADQFKDYWVAQAGQKGVKLDWDATWRNWVRNTKAAKPNPYDIGRVTVPSKNEPDPALLKIEEDAKKAAPIPLEVLAKMAELRRKA